MAAASSGFRSSGNQWPEGRVVTDRSTQAFRIGSPMALRSMSEEPVELSAHE